MPLKPRAGQERVGGETRAGSPLRSQPRAVFIPYNLPVLLVVGGGVGSLAPSIGEKN